jgi:hypothetical protein
MTDYLPDYERRKALDEADWARAEQERAQLQSETLPQGNVIVRLWRGQVPLVQTYWLYTVLGSVALRIIAPYYTYILTSNATNLSAFDFQMFDYLWILLALAFTVWTFVGTWRSANNYAVAKPNKGSNAALAKCAVTLGGLLTIATLILSVTTNYATDSVLHPATMDQRAQREALVAGWNANLPKQIDSITTLRKMDLTDNVITYMYDVKTVIDDAQSFTSKMRPKIVAAACSDHDTLELFKSRLTLSYLYSDEKAKNVADIRVSSSDCPKGIPDPS